MTLYYADAIAIDPATGQLAMSGSVLEQGQPTVQIVALTLRTELGTCVTDPDDGVDYTLADTDLPDTSVRMKDKITRALARYVDGGVIRDLTVSVETRAGQLLFEVSFVDPRSGARELVKGTR